MLGQVQVGQRHDPPVGPHRPDLLHLQHPAGGDPGPGAYRIEPELHVLAHIRLCCHAGWQPPPALAYSPNRRRGETPVQPARDGETRVEPRRGTGLRSGPSRGCLARLAAATGWGSAARPGLEVEDHGGAVVAHEPAGFSRALPRGRVQEREGGRLAVRAGEVLVLPGLLGAVAQAARLQPEQPRGAVAARGDAGLAAPLPEGLIQEVDGGLRAVRGGELRRLPGLLGAVAQAAWLQVDQPRGAVVAQRRGGLAAPLPPPLAREPHPDPLPVGGGELPGLPGLLPAVAQAAPPQPEQGGGAVIAEGRAGLTAPPPPRLRPQEYAGP